MQKIGISNVAEDVKDGVSNMTENADSAGVTNDSYTATRTDAQTGTTTNQNTFIWAILAVIAVAIIALVWYYGVQMQNQHGRNNF